MKEFRTSWFRVIGTDILIAIPIITLVLVKSNSIKADLLLILIATLLIYYYTLTQQNDIIVHSSRIEIYNPFRFWSPSRYVDFSFIRSVRVRSDMTISCIEIYTRDFSRHRFFCRGIKSRSLKELHELLRKSKIESEFVL